MRAGCCPKLRQQSGSDLSGGYSHRCCATTGEMGRLASVAEGRRAWGARQSGIVDITRCPLALMLMSVGLCARA